MAAASVISIVCWHDLIDIFEPPDATSVTERW
jgi:hypothetical protein